MKKLYFIGYIFFLQLLIVEAKGIYTQNILNKVNAKYGKATLNRFLLLKDIISQVKTADDMEKIKAINNFFNKVKYSLDIQVWNKKDYWATPFEFLGRDKGDSEDFALAKYFTLVYELNLSRNKFYFTYVKSIKKRVSYMVLTYYKTKKSMPIILDSINYKALPASRRKDIIPIYSFSANSSLNSKNSKFKLQQSSKFNQVLNNLRKGKV